MNRRRRKRFVRISLAVAAIGVIIAVIARNPIARFSAVQIVSRVLSTRVEVGNVHIGLAEVIVDDVIVFEPKDINQVQLSVRRITLVPTLWRGLKTGVWLDSVVIDQPRAHLRFNAGGQLTSVFPQSSEGGSNHITTIPVRMIRVRDAGLVVDQSGREEFSIDNAAMIARFERTIQIKAIIPDVLGSQFLFSSNVRAIDFAGSSHISLKALHLDTRRLAQLPLVPSEVNTEALTADLNFELNVEHPANESDLRRHGFDCRVVVDQLFSNQLKMLCQRFELTATGKDGKANLDITANPLDAAFSLACLADMVADKPSAQIHSTLKECHLQTIAQHIPELADLAATASVNLDSSLQWDSHQLAFTNHLTGQVVECEKDSMVLPEIQWEVTSEGSLAIADLTSPSGSVRVDVHSSNFDLTPIVEKMGVPRPTGMVAASCHVEIPLPTLLNPATYTSDIKLSATQLSASDEVIDDIHWIANLREGVLKTSPLTLKWRESTCVVRTIGMVGEDIAIDGDIAIDRLNIGDLSKVASRFSSQPLTAQGIAKLDGKFAIEKRRSVNQPFVSASGNVNIEQASYSRATIGNAKLHWAADVRGLTLTTVSDECFGGGFKATAKISELDWTKTQVEGQFASVEVPRLIGLTGNRIASTGTLEGGFRVTSLASLDELSGEAWVQSRQTSVRQLPVEIQQANITLNRGLVSVVGKGSVSQGRFIGSAHAEAAQLVSFFCEPSFVVSKIPVAGQFKLAGVPINKLCAAAELPRETQSAGGTLSFECSRQEGDWDGRHLCRATGSVEDLRYQHGELSQRISMSLAVHPDRVELSNIEGSFADGMLAGTGFVKFDSTPTGRFELVANRVNLRRASSPLGVKDVSGTGTIRLRGRIGPVITGRADVTLDDVVAVGVSIRQAQFPIDWSFATSSKTARWQCRAGAVSMGGGDVRIASEGNYAKSLNMTTSVRIEKIDLAKLMQGVSVASGTVDGNVLVRAKHARSLNDFVGIYQFEMQNIEAMQIPILDRLPKMISLSPPVPGRGEDGGTVRGRLGGGLVQVDEIAIHQSNIQLLVTGNASIDGRLDLDVIASTQSESPTDQLVSLMDSPLMLAAPAPIALIAKANDLLKDRVVRVHVGGTANRPTLRLQTGRQLSQDAVRFFLSNSLGTTGTRLSTSQQFRQRR